MGSPDKLWIRSHLGSIAQGPVDALATEHFEKVTIAHGECSRKCTSKAKGNLDKAIGSEFLFHIGGMAMMTIMINATLCGPLLKALGLTKTGPLSILFIGSVCTWLT